MSLQRIFLTQMDLRNYQPSLPVEQIPAFGQVLSQAKGARHVSPAMALSVAVDLLGMERVSNLIAGGGVRVLDSWISVVEDHGWSMHNRPKDIQTNLFLNGVKSVALVVAPNADSLRLQGVVTELVDRMIVPTHPLHYALVTSLVLNKGMDTPWTLITNVQLGEPESNYGIYAAP